MSSQMGYSKVGNKRSSSSSCHGGFKLKHSKRFSVQRLRARFVYFFRVLTRWRCFSYGQTLKRLKMRRNGSRNSCSSCSSKRSLMTTEGRSSNYNYEYCRLRSFARSNSFYSEAIADCLEFIKRSSISVEQKQACPR